MTFEAKIPGVYQFRPIAGHPAERIPHWKKMQGMKGDD
jgi:hypothetical protein